MNETMARTTMFAAAFLLAAGALAAPPADDAWIAGLEGGWTGRADETPMGPMPFAMLFDRQPDGRLACRTALNRETYVHLEFYRDADGRWMLDESAALEGLGQQAYTLAPVATDGPERRWEMTERPGFLAIELLREEETLRLDVTVHGTPHASFAMRRMDDDDLPAMRAALARQAKLSPAEQSIDDVLAARDRGPAASGSADPEDDGNPDDPIAAARARAAARPDDARAQLALARELGAAIQSDASNGPRYAFELLQTLQKTVALDPTLGEAYAYLVGYYLNAPAIAGGSVDKAEETARALAALDPEAGEALLEQVQRHRATTDQAADR